jgi:plasmid stabilization system protein ParE
MSLPLLIIPEAEADIAEARAWYEQQRPGLGEQLVLCVEDALDRIARLPELGTEVFPAVRRVLVRRFPYGIFYRVDPDQIAVIAVYHSKRDPRGWQARA